MPRFVICSAPPSFVVPVAQFTTRVPLLPTGVPDFRCRDTLLEDDPFLTNLGYLLHLLDHTSVNRPPNPALEPTARPRCIVSSRAAARTLSLARNADVTTHWLH